MILPPRGSARRTGPRIPIAAEALSRERCLGPGVARFAKVAVLAALLFATGACTHRSSATDTTGSPHSARQKPTETPEPTYAQTISFADGTLPDLSHREFELPAGSNLTDRTDRFAVYAHNSPGHPHSLFGLLDLSTGVSRIVLLRAVNEARSFDTFAPRLSDSWMAWEEVSPNESGDPNNAQWRLYAARIDARNLTLGTPVLVDKGVSNYELRPHYVVLDSTVYWTANLRAGPHQENFPPSSSICALDLAKGKKRILCETNTSYPTLCAAEGLLSATEIVSTKSAYRVRALLIAPDTGELVLRRDLGNTWRISHFLRASREWLAWAAQPADGAEWPTLYLASRSRSGSPTTGVSSDGNVLMVGIDSIDPAFFGSYLAFESVEASSGGSIGGATRRARRIWVADLKHRTRSVLLETQDATTGGWWQTCASSLQTQTLLLWNDLGPWVEDQRLAKTIVRLYTAVP